MIDVVINCYNDAELFPDALDSVLRQTAYDRIDKIILMDDGSTDNTPEVLKKYDDPKITHVYQENAGLANARNTAFANCEAPYISFLDADDIWTDDKLEKQLKVILENPEVDILYSNVYAFYGNYPSPHYEQFRSTSYFGTGNLEKFFVYDAPIYPSTVVIKRDIYQKLDGFDDSFRKSEDTEMWLRVLGEGYSFHMDEYLVYRRMSQTSLGADLEVLMPYQRRIEEKICARYPQLTPLKSQRHAEQYFTSAKEKITKFGHIKKARSFLKKHLKIRPANLEAWGLLLFSYIPFISRPNVSNKIKQAYKKLTGKYNDR